MSNQRTQGTPVYRGPMATDHYTQVHNLICRGHAWHTKYVGVWAYITSNVEGWEMSVPDISRDLDVGRDFVRNALRAFESARCLVRGQLRDSAGQLGTQVWFATDLPLQLRQLGITDTAAIGKHVDDAFARWRNASYPQAEQRPAPATDFQAPVLRCDDAASAEATPATDFQAPDVTSENGASAQDTPETENPSPVPPAKTGVNSQRTAPPKKNKKNRKKNTPSSSSVSPDAAPAERAGSSNGEENPANSQPENTTNPVEGTGASCSDHDTDRAGTHDTTDRDPSGADSAHSDHHTPTVEETPQPGGEIAAADHSALTDRFWAALPAPVAPNAAARTGHVAAHVAALLDAPNTWHLDPEGPERLADWFARRVPTHAVGNPAGWVISQCRYAPAGPEERPVTAWENCPYGCDRYGFLYADGDPDNPPSRCPVTHRRDHHEPTRADGNATTDRDDDPDAIAATIRRSIGLDSQPDTVPAGATSGGTDDPPF